MIYLYFQTTVIFLNSHIGPNSNSKIGTRPMSRVLVSVHRFIFKFWIKDLVSILVQILVSVLVYGFGFGVGSDFIIYNLNQIWLMVENLAQKKSG